MNFQSFIKDAREQLIEQVEEEINAAVADGRLIVEISSLETYHDFSTNRIKIASQVFLRGPDYKKIELIEKENAELKEKLNKIKESL